MRASLCVRWLRCGRTSGSADARCAPNSSPRANTSCNNSSRLKHSRSRQPQRQRQRPPPSICLVRRWCRLSSRQRLRPGADPTLRLSANAPIDSACTMPLWRRRRRHKPLSHRLHRLLIHLPRLYHCLPLPLPLPPLPLRLLLSLPPLLCLCLHRPQPLHLRLSFSLHSHLSPLPPPPLPPPAHSPLRLALRPTTTLYPICNSHLTHVPPLPLQRLQRLPPPPQRPAHVVLVVVVVRRRDLTMD